MPSGSTLESVAAFAAVAGVLVVTPGVGTAYLMSTVIAAGRRAGYLTAIGMVLGAAIHALGAALGTALLLRLFPQSLSWIAILGGGYIIWLGARGILRTIRPPPPPSSDRAERIAAGHHTHVATGMLIALGNAPLPLFYLVVVPQYLPASMPRFAGAALLSLVHLTMAGTWMATIVTLVSRLVDVLRRPRVFITMQVLTGLALIWLGIQSVTRAF